MARQCRIQIRGATAPTTSAFSDPGRCHVAAPAAPHAWRGSIISLGTVKSVNLKKINNVIFENRLKNVKKIPYLHSPVATPVPSF